MALPKGPGLVMRKLRLPLALTWGGLMAQAVLRAFWPLISIVLFALALTMLGLHDLVPVEVVWGMGALCVLAAVVTGIRGIRRLQWPTQAQALARLDETLPGRPIQALLDDQAIGSTDAASVAVWRAHQARMAERVATAQAPAPDLRLARSDPFALRYVALLTFLVALLFGSIWRVATVADMAPSKLDLASGPAWEGWVEPPRYTAKPTLYLADVRGNDLPVPEGSRITLRFYGEVGALSLAETVSQRGEAPPASDPVQDFTVARNGELRIDGPGGRGWAVRIVPDAAPEIAIEGTAEAEATGEMKLPFTASDDYGVIAGQAVIALDQDAIVRRYGLAADPDAREALLVPLPMPIAGDRRAFSETLIEDYSKHAWANLPVTFTLSVEDAAGQVTQTPATAMVLPARRFFDPLAAAVIEQRRDLLWARANAPRVAQILRAVSHRPEDLFRSQTAYLRLRFILRRLETATIRGLKAEQQEELAEALWDLAIQLEEGDLADALERLRRAQERLSEAMKDGASDQEIAELMQELRQATDNYLQQLSRQAQQNGEQGDQQQAQNSMQMTQDDLQRMMDRIQELMEQGRMAEAEQALQELQQMMENMRVTQGQGQGSQSAGQQAMEGLAETLREQQGLSDQAFRDLQEQFNPGAQAGESQGNQGRNGGQGRGQSHQGEGQGRGQADGDDGDGTQQGQESLADRQQALRDELGRQQGRMPGAGTPAGDAAREALDRAGRAMEGAEQSLRQDDYAGAIDQQSEAMEALREGMRALGEAMAEQQQSQPGQGSAEGDMQTQNRDPLGRNTGSNGSLGSPENLLQGEDVYRRARELLDEIRRRSGEGERPEVERNYLQRLLERF
ncbi:TIGR02302 family protein [Sedimentitalea nanhaiensis]|uniref:TIGR02302 family protein n=1 Tax=Sedimentitalea nanhaiensis TaxID=999627 RepID=A0A1I7CPX5_9RHOB|nr:TIGR02302 family protein [Sedimentitalea nanhaiensis]SFU01448.1 TIGR02302 family protein [Sedimentitalea nanhaiensis]